MIASVNAHPENKSNYWRDDKAEEKKLKGKGRGSRHVGRAYMEQLILGADDEGLSAER